MILIKGDSPQNNTVTKDNNFVSVHVSASPVALWALRMWKIHKKPVEGGTNFDTTMEEMLEHKSAVELFMLITDLS